MFHLLDNILIFGIFVFAVVMAIHVVSANTPQEEKKPEIKAKDVSTPSSLEDKDSST